MVYPNVDVEVRDFKIAAMPSRFGQLDDVHAGIDDAVFDLNWCPSGPIGMSANGKTKKGAIIAFTGPPGVGKTSIAGAIAQALGRKFG